MYEIHNHSILQLVFCPQNKILKQGRIFKISGDIGSGGEAGLEYRKIYWPLWYYKFNKYHDKEKINSYYREGPVYTTGPPKNTLRY